FESGAGAPRSKSRHKLQHPRLARAQALDADGRQDTDVLELDPAGMLDQIGAVDAIEDAMGDADAVDRRAGETGDVEYARGGLARHVFELDVAHDRQVCALRPLLIHEIHRD